MKIINRKCALICGLLVALCSGCTTNMQGTMGSCFSATITQEHLSAITSDIVEFIAWQYPPAKTQLDFHSIKPNDQFATQLKDKLRSFGFSISENAGSGLKFSFIADNQDQTVRVILLVGNKKFVKSFSNGNTLSKWSSTTDQGVAND